MATRRAVPRHDPLCKIIADQKLGEAVARSPRSAAGRTGELSLGTRSGAAEHTRHGLFIRCCGDEVRERCEILLDLDATDDPDHGHRSGCQKQMSWLRKAKPQASSVPQVFRIHGATRFGIGVSHGHTERMDVPDEDQGGLRLPSHAMPRKFIWRPLSSASRHNRRARDPIRRR